MDMVTFSGGHRRKVVKISGGLEARGSEAVERVSGWGGHHGECGARAYNGPGAEPLVRGSGGEAPLKLKAFWSLDVQRSRQI